ncbi:MAG: hypothetical protein ABI972_08180 [Acidobacteriota bacterium]
MADRIPAPATLVDDTPVTFSFKYLDLETNPKFAFDLCDLVFIKALLVELSTRSGIPICDFCEWDNGRQNHRIVFQETTEPNGFPGLNEQIQPDEFWQFGIIATRQWRVHGFFLDSVFYIVWLDPTHSLYGRG